MKIFAFCVIEIFLFIKIFAVTEKEVVELTKYLEENIRKTDISQMPVNNFKYRPNISETIKEFGEYDFIIVGAGYTGTVLANRLSEKKNWKILLLEAGGYGDTFVSVPVMLYRLRHTKYDWGYKSVPQKHACLGMMDKVCGVPRGKGIGGTSLINGQIYVRGHPKQFDKWAELGNPGWSYNEILPLFKKLEGLVDSNPLAYVNWTYHNNSGPLYLEYYYNNDIQIDAFYNANKELNYQLVDVNSPHQIGVSPTLAGIKDGKRFDAGTALIEPILKRTNLKVMTESYVIKINFKNKRATGVTFSHNGRLFAAYAKKEVIISTGAINSPQLLMLSGIGPRKHLKRNNIRVISNLPVGMMYKEQPMYLGLLFSTNYSEPIKSFEGYVREFLSGLGPLTVTGEMRAVGFYRTKLATDIGVPDLEIMYSAGNCTDPFLKQFYRFTDDTWNSTFTNVNPAKCFSLLPILLNPTSSGSLKLKSNNPYEFPLINPNYLSKPKDVETMYEGIKLSLKLIKTEAFKKLDVKLAIKPLPACKEHTFLSREYFYCSIQHLSGDIFHPVGTCPMGPDPSRYVVDHKLNVYGVENLRVADASIFPTTLAGHPTAPCAMIGEKLANILKNKYHYK